MKTMLSLAIFIALKFVAVSQISVQNTSTPAQLVQNILLGSGYSATNITVNGGPGNSIVNNVSYFQTNGSNFLINDGVLLTTGKYQTAIGPNDEEGGELSDTLNPIIIDSDLNTLVGNDTMVKNGVVLEFDFQALSDTFSFEYVFASEEYNEFVGSDYNDIFGFFLSGQGITGPFSNNAKNIAVLPTTSTNSNVVSINNVNNGNDDFNFSPKNSFYYLNNENSQAFGNAIQYDGATKILKAGSKLVCGQMYHLKLALANVGDQEYGSAVFIKSKSFILNDLTFEMPEFNGYPIYEGCQNQNDSILIIRPSNQVSNPLTITVNYQGSATINTDYTSPGNSFTFNSGEDSLYIHVNTLSDNITEGVESVILSLSYMNYCGSLITVSDTFYIQDKKEVIAKASDSTFFCPNYFAHVNVQSGLPPYTYLWSTNSTNDSITITDTLLQKLNNYLVTVTDICGNSDTDTSTITYLPVSANLNADSSVYILPSNSIFINTSENATNYTWFFGDGEIALTNNLNNVSHNYSDTGVYYISIVAHNGICVDTAAIWIYLVSHPKVIAPNVFTPNGDDINDVFFLREEFVKNLNLKILDRWGLLLYEEESKNPTWNGLDQKGNPLPDGVYYFLYHAEGYGKESVGGEGFVHLISTK